ncbi:MAG: hypothetical protein OXI32_03330 [bacterium]|nr:hypothetical protein [bacterium]
MPRRREPVRFPASYLVEEGVWPDGPFAADAPPEVYLAAGISRRVQHIAGDRNLAFQTIAEQAGVSIQAVMDIVRGRSWPTLRTVARVECALDAQLWKNEHRRRMPPRGERAIRKVLKP